MSANSPANRNGPTSLTSTGNQLRANMLMTGFAAQTSDEFSLSQKRVSNQKENPAAIKTPLENRPKEGVALPSVIQTKSAVHTAGALLKETDGFNSNKAAVKSGVAAAVKVVKNESVPESEVSGFKDSS